MRSLAQRLLCLRGGCAVRSLQTRGYTRPILKDFREQLRPLGAGKVTLEGLNTQVALITLHNPTRRNALDGKMMAELADAVDELQKWDGCCAIVTGAAFTWCSGADLAVVRAQHPELQGEVMCRLMTDSLTRLYQCDVISVAAIEGKAVGGGAEFTTACDHRVIASNATIQFVHASMGVTPGWGGGGRLIQLVGRRQALRLLPGSPLLNANAALECGLVDAISEPQKAVEKAREVLAPYLAQNKAVVKRHKALIANWCPLDVARQEVECQIFSGMWGADHNTEALKKNPKGRIKVGKEAAPQKH